MFKLKFRVELNKSLPLVGSILTLFLILSIGASTKANFTHTRSNFSRITAYSNYTTGNFTHTQPTSTFTTQQDASNSRYNRPQLQRPVQTGHYRNLTCHCNVCGENETSCQVLRQREATCYKSITYSQEATYGCFPDEGDTLFHFQCRVDGIRFAKPTYMKCCNDEDFCNLDLPDPTEKDDPRWNSDELNEHNWDRLVANIELWHIAFITVVFFVIFIVLWFIVLPRCSTGIPESKGSIWTIKQESERLARQHAASSSLSTHSCSISDDCHKSDPVTNDESSIHDLTSGLGHDERLLNLRTMARAVGSQQTSYVGNGRFGRVFRAEYHGEDVAVKAFRTIDQDSWKREDTIFRTLNHESIVRFIASEVTSVENGTTEIWMFLEYCPFGSLCDFLDHNEILGQQQAVKILYSIINGLNYLHEDYAQASRLYKPSIAHRDIKSKNILMRTPESCCIADFGHALIKLDEETLDYGKYQDLQVGTIRYMAPEILKPDKSSNYRHFLTFAQADIYQFGLVLWEVCHRTALDIIHPANTHKLPYDVVQNPSVQDMIKIVCEDQYRPPRFDIWYSLEYPLMQKLAYLMEDCWRPKPDARMGTLGVKKKLKELYDQVVPNLRQQYINPSNNSTTTSTQGMTGQN